MSTDAAKRIQALLRDPGDATGADIVDALRADERIDATDKRRVWRLYVAIQQRLVRAGQIDVTDLEALDAVLDEAGVPPCTSMFESERP